MQHSTAQVGSASVADLFSRQIFITYGELPNARLLLRYGFVEENNEFDYVQVRAHTHTHTTTHNTTTDALQCL